MTVYVTEVEHSNLAYDFRWDIVSVWLSKDYADAEVANWNSRHVGRAQMRVTQYETCD